MTLVASAPAAAQDATWTAGGMPNSDYNQGANWSGGQVPTGIATFGASAITNIVSAATNTVGGWTFDVGASNYTFTSGILHFDGAGIVINGGSATINTNFVLTFINNSTAGNATINNTFIVVFRNTATAGSATINHISVGPSSFADSSTAGSATINNSFQLNFRHTSTAGNATITTTNAASTKFQENSTGGNAQFVTNSGGLLDFSFSTGPNNDNRISAGSIAGAGDIFLGSNALTVGGNNLSTTVAGVLSHCGATGAACNLFLSSGTTPTGGSLVKIGTGTLTLTGNNIYTGATTVNAGGLVVNGSIASSSALNINGGFVGGSGTLPTTVVGNGGALSPGNSIGTINVQGNLTFNAGSTYTVEFSPDAADRTNVTGAVTINGGTVQATALPGSFRARTYTILNAGSITGTFAGLTVIGAALGSQVRNPHLSYDPNNVYLVLNPDSLAVPAGAGGNASNVGAAINNAVQGGATPPAAFDALLNATGSQLTSALMQVSGPAPTGATTSATQLMNGFLSLTLNPYGGAPQGNPGAFGYARAMGASESAPLPKEAADAFAAIMPVKAAPITPFEQRWSVWGQGYGGYNKTDGSATAGTADTTSRAWGFAGGADYRVTRDTTLGFALAGGETRWSLAQGLGGGKSDVFQAGLYGSHSFGAAYISGALAYAWYDAKTDRNVTVSGIDVLRASFDAHSFGGRLEAGYRFASSFAGVTPYIAGQVQNFRTPSYREAAVSGANTFALSYNSRDTTATRFELGSWFDKLIAMNDGHAIVLRGRAAWAHDEGSNGGISAAFQTLPGSSFTVNGAAAPKDLALVSAGGELRLRNGVSLGARFDGEFASRAQTYAGTGTARYAW